MPAGKSIAAVGGCALLALALNVQPAAAEPIELKFHIFIPPVANPVKTYWQPWIDKVNAQAKGQMKVTLYPSMQLGGKPPQLTDQVKDGVVDLAWTLPSYNPGRFPKTEAFELPFVHTTALASTLALQDFQEKHLQDEYKDYHVLLLHTHDGELFMTKRAIRKASDIRGLKIRVLSRQGAWFIAALGGNPVGAPLPEIPQMLSKGVIQGSLLPYEIAPAIKMQELVGHFSEMAGDKPRVHSGVFSFLMNKQSYNKLPADMKKIIDANSGRNIAASAGKNWMAIEVPGKKVMQSNPKNQFHVIPPNEVAKMKKVAETVIQRWIKEMNDKGYDGKMLYEDAVAMVARHSS